MDDPKLLSHDSSIPLIARLDHLEFIMKYLERKQRCGGSNVVTTTAEKSSSDSSSAVKDDFFKGTLLDRVASLEQRLSQLCTEIDTSGSSNPLSGASTQTSGESSSSQGSKGELYYSFPTFNNILPNNNTDTELMALNHTKTFPLPIPEISESVVQQQPKKACPPKQEVVVVKNNKGKKKEKKNNKSEKKQIAPVSWPHLKLLGC